MGYKIRAIKGNNILYLNQMQQFDHDGHEWEKEQTVKNLVKNIKNSKAYKKCPYNLAIVKDETICEKEPQEEVNTYTDNFRIHQIQNAVDLFLSLTEEDVNELKAYITHCDRAVTDIEHHIELTADASDEEKCDCFDFIRCVKRRRRKAKDALTILETIQALNLPDRKYNVRQINELFEKGKAVSGNPYAALKSKV